MEMLAKKPLFNPDGDTDVRLRRMIGGNILSGSCRRRRRRKGSRARWLSGSKGSPPSRVSPLM